MRISICILSTIAGVSLLTAGCSGPEKKLGSGLGNITEFARMGEIRRSMEQSALWDGPNGGYARGFFHGFNRSVARTAVGAYQVATFPIPSYETPFKTYFQDGQNYLSPKPKYPDSYKPAALADPMFGPDGNLGFYGGDVFPFVPGSRFRVFDY